MVFSSLGRCVATSIVSFSRHQFHIFCAIELSCCFLPPILLKYDTAVVLSICKSTTIQHVPSILITKLSTLQIYQTFQKYKPQQPQIKQQQLKLFHHENQHSHQANNRNFVEGLQVKSLCY